MLDTHCDSACIPDQLSMNAQRPSCQVLKSLSPVDVPSAQAYSLLPTCVERVRVLHQYKHNIASEVELSIIVHSAKAVLMRLIAADLAVFVGLY